MDDKELLLRLKSVKAMSRIVAGGMELLTHKAQMVLEDLNMLMAECDSLTSDLKKRGVK